MKPWTVVVALLAAAAAAPSAPARAAIAPNVPFISAAVVARGLPPRPDLTGDSARDRVWERVIHAAHAPMDIDFFPAPATLPQRVTQPDWAGAVLFSPGAVNFVIPQHRFHSVEGEWVVPEAHPTINCSRPAEQEDGSSLWIAIDGWLGTDRRTNSTDILQAGSESDVPCYAGGSPDKYQTSSYFWIEWSGTKNIAVAPPHTNEPVHPGDLIYVRIDAHTTGPDAWRVATLWFVNETTGRYLPARTFHSGCLDCGTPNQHPAVLFGDTAEWMTEATFYDYADPSLPNTLDGFGNVRLTSASVTDEQGTTYEPGAPLAATQNIDWMTWNGIPLQNGGTLLACSRITGPGTVIFSRAPYVIETPGHQGDLEPKPQSCKV